MFNSIVILMIFFDYNLVTRVVAWPPSSKDEDNTSSSTVTIGGGKAVTVTTTSVRYVTNQNQHPVQNIQQQGSTTTSVTISKPQAAKGVTFKDTIAMNNGQETSSVQYTMSKGNGNNIFGCLLLDSSVEGTVS